MLLSQLDANEAQRAYYQEFLQRFHKESEALLAWPKKPCSHKSMPTETSRTPGLFDPRTVPLLHANCALMQLLPLAEQLIASYCLISRPLLRLQGFKECRMCMWACSDSAIIIIEQQQGV